VAAAELTEDEEDGLPPTIAGYGGSRGMARGRLRVWLSTGASIYREGRLVRRRQWIGTVNRRSVARGRMAMAGGVRQGERMSLSCSRGSWQARVVGAALPWQGCAADAGVPPREL
jgi:hypothetical protein